MVALFNHYLMQRQQPIMLQILFILLFDSLDGHYDNIITANEFMYNLDELIEDLSIQSLLIFMMMR